MLQNQDFACNCSRIICFQHSVFFISCSSVCFILIFLTYLKQDKNATCGKPQFFQIGKFSIAILSNSSPLVASLLLKKKVARIKKNRSNSDSSSSFSIIDFDLFNLQLFNVTRTVRHLFNTVIYCLAKIALHQDLVDAVSQLLLFIALVNQ